MMSDLNERCLKKFPFPVEYVWVVKKFLCRAMMSVIHVHYSTFLCLFYNEYCIDPTRTRPVFVLRSLFFVFTFFRARVWRCFQ